MNGKVIWLAVLAGFVIFGLLLVVILRSRQNTSRTTEDSPGRRLLAHSRDREDYRLFVGMPPTTPGEWVEVAEIRESSVTLRNNQVLDLKEVTAYFVTLPSGGPVDIRNPTKLPLPNWVKFPVQATTPEQDELTQEDLKEGRSLVRVAFGKSTSHPNSSDHYSTTLTNLSAMRVRVLKFGGYAKSGRVYSLNTITRQFFSAEDFRDWYGQDGEWIEPGQSATDPNNYGSPPVLWAYYCEAENGQQFVTGGVIE
jgi:hypothetical protein